MTAIILSAPFAPRSPAFAAVSGSSVTIQAGGLATFTVPAGLAYTVGTRVRIVSVTTGNWMEGVVNSYTGTTLVVELTSAQGAGTFSSWYINLAGEPGLLPPLPGILSNALMTESHLSNAVTFTLKTIGGTDPSAVNPIRALFPDGSSGTVSTVLSLTVPQGVTLGAANNVPVRVWILLINNQGTLQLGAFQSREPTVNSITGLPPNGILPTTMYGNGAGQIYTFNPVVPVPYLVVGVADYDQGLATAGNWSVSPTRITMHGLGSRLPGTLIQEVGTQSGAMMTSTAQFPSFTDTIPTNGQGALIISQGITPINGASVLEVEAQIMMQSATSDVITTLLSRTDITNVLSSLWTFINECPHLHLTRIVAWTVVPLTFQVRAGSHNAATGWTVNGSNGAGYYGGTFNTYLRIREYAT